MFKKLLSIAILAIILTFSANAAKIKLEIPIIKNGPTVTDTLDNGQIVTYDVSSDDAEQENDEMDKLFDDDLDTGWEGAPDKQNVMTVGLRFQKITIPQGAKIDSAFVRFYAHESKTIDDLAKITIAGENSDNAETWNLETLITDRPRTTAQVNWNVAEDWAMWNVYYTPDLKDIVQEIVNRSGWVSGNSLALMLLGEDQGPSDYENTREFESFENISDPEEGGDGQNHPERVPTLFVYFSSANSVESTEASAYSVFPNPSFDGAVQVIGNDLMNTKITVYDQLGNSVMEVTPNSNFAVSVNINKFDAGVYYFYINNNGNISIQKVIKL